MICAIKVKNEKSRCLHRLSELKNARSAGKNAGETCRLNHDSTPQYRDSQAAFPLPDQEDLAPRSPSAPIPFSAAGLAKPVGGRYF